MYKAGDIVRFLYNSEQTAMIIGFAGNNGVYDDDDRFVMALRDDGDIISFLFNSKDWEIVDHVDMAEIMKRIREAKG